MTNEEMHRTMEFIIEQQAQFATNIQRLQEERIRDNPRLTRSRPTTHSSGLTACFPLINVACLL